ncbi:MAG: hypothetical protein ACJ72N_07260 [Labedaea sp.]|jgi:hypothetical protein
MSDRGEKLLPLDDEHEFESMEIFWKLATEGQKLTNAKFAVECQRLEELGWYYDHKSKRWTRDLQPRSWNSRQLTPEDSAMSDIKATVRATGTVTYDTPTVASGEPVPATTPLDATQFDRLKDLFDEFGVKYEVLTDEARSQFDFQVKPGEKWLMTDAGKGYSGFYAIYAFNADGRFLGYSVAE